MAEPVPSNTKVDQMKKMIDLKDRKDEIERELKDNAKEYKALEDAVLEWFEGAGIQNISIEGRTLYIASQTWTRGKSGVDPEIVVDMLKAHGLEDLVKETFNVQSLSAHVRRLDEEGGELPQELADVLSTTETTHVSIRRK